MPKIKLTLTVLKSAQKENKDYELRDTDVPSFLVKVTPAGKMIFMAARKASNGVRRNPVLGRFSKLTVEQARELAKNWLAEVRQGKDPSVTRSSQRQSPTMQEYFGRSMADHSEARNKPPQAVPPRRYGPPYDKFGVWVRYAVLDLDRWVNSFRWITTSAPDLKPTPLPKPADTPRG
jgi:hypothetical protein